jgi:rubrerythrin
MITVNEMFCRFYPHYRQQYTPSPQQAKAARDIINCRTAALGGRVYECDACGHTVVRYNSCRNRHCPTCQGVAKEFGGGGNYTQIKRLCG